MDRLKEAQEELEEAERLLGWYSIEDPFNDKEITHLERRKERAIQEIEDLEAQALLTEKSRNLEERKEDKS